MTTEFKPEKITRMIRFLIDKKWAPKWVIDGKNIRVIAVPVLFCGKEARFDNPACDIRYCVGGQPAYVHTGNDASDAEEQRRRFAEQ